MLASESRARGAQRTAALRSRRNQLLVPIEVPLKPGHVKSRASGEVGRRKRGTSAAEHGCHDLAKGAEVDALALRLVRFRHQLLHVHRRNVDSELGLRVPALSNRILRLASRSCILSDMRRSRLPHTSASTSTRAKPLQQRSLQIKVNGSVVRRADACCLPGARRAAHPRRCHRSRRGPFL